MRLYFHFLLLLHALRLSSRLGTFVTDDILPPPLIFLLLGNRDRRRKKEIKRGPPSSIFNLALLFPSLPCLHGPRVIHCANDVSPCWIALDGRKEKRNGDVFGKSLFVAFDCGATDRCRRLSLSLPCHISNQEMPGKSWGSSFQAEIIRLLPSYENVCGVDFKKEMLEQKIVQYLKTLKQPAPTFYTVFCTPSMYAWIVEQWLYVHSNTQKCRVP